jgi:hypothetical protein
MANHRIPDPDSLMDQDEPKMPPGHDVRSLGPSDSSDTGADMAGPGLLEDTSDRNGTGVHTTAGKEPDVRIGDDIAPDRIVGAEEAGLGGGLDEAEEARRSTEPAGRGKRPNRATGKRTGAKSH